jgi:hypothetical protein
MSISTSWKPGEHVVTWECDGVSGGREFDEPPAAVAVWDEPPSVIVVEPLHPGGRLDNAVVFDPQGEERVRIQPPQLGGEPNWRLGYYTAYVSQGVLTVVFQTTVGDFWGVPDLETGELKNVTEWR